MTPSALLPLVRKGLDVLLAGRATLSTASTSRRRAASSRASASSSRCQSSAKAQRTHAEEKISALVATFCDELCRWRRVLQGVKLSDTEVRLKFRRVKLLRRSRLLKTLVVPLPPSWCAACA
eukprot:5268493-Prymnesium_polylepis.2